MNNKDLEKLRKEIRREARASSRMLGCVLMVTLVMLISLCALASCSTTKPLTDYEKHQVAIKEYLDKTDLMGTPHSVLQEMWRAAYIEAMINMELR